MIIAIEANSAASSIVNGDTIKGAVRHCYNHADIASRHWLAVIYDDGSDDALTTDILNRIQAHNNPRRFTHSGLLPKLVKLSDRPSGDRYRAGGGYISPRRL